jgi:pyruvate,orthophosphate dikinase
MKVLDKAVLDTDLTVGALKAVSFLMTQKFQAATQKEFPNTLGAQLAAAILAVFDSWESPRAIEYRKLNSIPDDMGTAVTIQAMVFGNMGKSSGTGVLFTRNPSTGEPGMFGEFLENAQGEDVVAGIRTPHPVEGMIGKWNYNTNGLDFTWPDVHAQLLALCSKLETIYNDMVDIEFTVQQGKLYILQSRSGKRSARAAFRIAVDKVGAGEWTRLDAFKKLSSEQFKTLRRPQIDPDYKVKPDFTGIPGCPGVVTAQPVFSSADAVAAKFDCILVTHETSPNDIAGMAKAKGILTAMGGATSHAAVVARAMDKTCVVGVGPHMLDNAGKWKTVTIDGSTGRVWINQEVPVIDASDDKAVQNVIDWSFEMLGTCPPVPCDMGAAKPHRIMASQWWGSEEVMTAVLDGLAALPMRMHVTLDVRPPKAFLNEADDTLRETFGNLTVKTDPFVKVLQNAIKIRGKALAGLIIDHDGHTAAPKAMPAEYAVFSVLGA